MKRESTKNLTLTAMFFALGLILPLVTGQIPQIASMILPMHIPVFLCALICGWRYGLPMALILPVFRSVLFGVPVLYPMAVSMAFELGTYAFVSGFMYGRSRWQCTRALYRCLLAAMISGRVVWGLVQAVLLGLTGVPFTFKAFITAAVLGGIPGIVIQLILIPAVMVSLDRTKAVPFRRESTKREYSN